MIDPWLTVKDAAAQLGVHPQFIYSAIGVLGLPHVRIGKGRGKIRLRQSALNAWCEARAQRA